MAKESRRVCDALKVDKVYASGTAISARIAARLCEGAGDAFDDLRALISADATLVPTPRSSLLKPSSLWPAERLANALLAQGFGSDVEALIERQEPVLKSATARPGDRPPPSTHFNSMRCVLGGDAERVFVLIDDVVTRGATLLGAAGRLLEAWPRSRVVALAAIRTMSDEDEVELIAPCVGSITLNGDNPKRRP